MAVSSTPARSEDPTARPPGRRAARGEGQWALGHREPLNPNERIKKDDDPLNVRARIENIYAHRGFASHRPAGPARPVPLVGPLHPAQARHRRRAHRRAGAARARGRVLHAPGPHRRRPAQPGPAAGDRGHLPASSPGTPPTSPTGRTSSCTGSGSRTCRRSGAGWRRSACRPPRPAATARGSCSAARSPGSPRDEMLDPTPAIDEIVARYVGDPQFSNLPRKFKTSISWLADTPYEVERHRLPRRRPPRARPRLRPLGRRRPVHQPDARPAARRLGAAGRDARRVGRAWSGSSATTATAGCATGPG